MKYDNEKTEKANRSNWTGEPADVWNGRVNQNDVPAAERPCYARGCPELGTITEQVINSDAARWFCRAHSGRPPTEWDAITSVLRKTPVRPAEPPPTARLTPQEAFAEIRGILADRQGGTIAGTWRHVGGMGAEHDPKEWAKLLQVREEAGENLTPLQRQAWREALGVR